MLMWPLIMVLGKWDVARHVELTSMFCKSVKKEEKVARRGIREGFTGRSLWGIFKFP